VLNSAQKTLRHLPPKVLFHDNRWRKETKGELTNPGSHGKWLLKWRYMGVIMKR